MSFLSPMNQAVSLEAALAEFRAGRPVLVKDDAQREDEADIICAAEVMDELAMTMMIRDGSGIVCLCLTPEKAQALGLRPMVEDNRSRFATAFTQSIDAEDGITTGVSARDRLLTVRAALASSERQRRFVSPGHMFPLIARPGGVLERAGHTEAAVDLARMAGLMPAAVLCELMNPDGTMARGDTIAAYANRYGLAVITIEALIRHRTLTERQ